MILLVVEIKPMVEGERVAGTPMERMDQMNA
jgi:hypothetical protein